MTALGAATGENVAAALGAGADEEAVRAGTLGLGRLVGTLGSHDEFLSENTEVNVLHPWAQAALQVKKHATPGGCARRQNDS